MQRERLNAPGLEEFEKTKGDPATVKKAFPFNGDFAALHPQLAREILVFNAKVAGLEITANADLARLSQQLIPEFVRRDPKFRKKLEEISDYNKNLEAGQERKVLGITDLNSEAVALATGTHLPVWRQWVDWFSGQAPDVKKQQELIGYDHDGAFPLLIRHLAPEGLRGFVIAALMGAVVSSLAAMLNAASTIFTMDVYREYLNRGASQSSLVLTGRMCVPVAVLVGCLIAPQLAKPEFQGAFHFIQEFQGYISPGVLTVFLFGLFVPWSPRICGAIGLVLCPIVYGLLHLFWSDLAFLNRMAITVGVLGLVLGAITMIAPLQERVSLPEQQKFDMTSSGGAKIFGLIVVAATVVLYIVFW
jgi:hypothetical protein